MPITLRAVSAISSPFSFWRASPSAGCSGDAERARRGRRRWRTVAVPVRPLEQAARPVRAVLRARREEPASAAMLSALAVWALVGAGTGGADAGGAGTGGSLGWQRWFRRCRDGRIGRRWRDRRHERRIRGLWRQRRQLCGRELRIGRHRRVQQAHRTRHDERNHRPHVEGDDGRFSRQDGGAPDERRCAELQERGARSGDGEWRGAQLLRALRVQRQGHGGAARQGRRCPATRRGRVVRGSYRATTASRSRR